MRNKLKKISKNNIKNKLRNVFRDSKGSVGGRLVFIIAEMAWSHDGSIEKAKKIIKGAAEAGADAISLHITNMEDYMAKGYGCAAGQNVSAGHEQSKIYDYMDKINLKDGDWEEIIPFAKNLGLAVCVMPNDGKSLELAEKLNSDIYVISPASFLEEDFIIKVAKKKRPVILRIGGATIKEIENVVNLIKKNGNKKIILLPGIQLYPTKIEDNNVNLVSYLSKVFKLTVGFADHVDAELDLAFTIPLMTLPLGVAVIEKHITHNRSLRGEDFEAALNPEEFKKFVSHLREAEKSLGMNDLKLSKAELKYRGVVRKKTVAARNIKKNEKITKDNIVFKRSDEGVSPDEAKLFIGKIARADIKKDEPVLRNKIK